MPSASNATIDPTIVEIIDDAVAAPSGMRLFTTLEGENPSGSLKDRLVLGELTELLDAGVLRRGDVVSEVSAGSTARSLAHYCRQLGLECQLFVPVTMAGDDVDRLRALGADVQQVTREDAYPTYERFCAQHRTHRFEQLSDPKKKRHYASLGAAVAAVAGPVGAIVGAVGTGHSLLGSAEGIIPSPMVVSAEPDQPGAIPGVRNVDLERYGPADACAPEQFDQRVILAPDELVPVDSIKTDAGEIRVGDSFRLVLAAAARLGAESQFARVFVLGAENRRPLHPT